MLRRLLGGHPPAVKVYGMMLALTMRVAEEWRAQVLCDDEVTGYDLIIDKHSLLWKYFTYTGKFPVDVRKMQQLYKIGVICDKTSPCCLQDPCCLFQKMGWVRSPAA